jgi:hypothetical protein
VDVYDTPSSPGQWALISYVVLFSLYFHPFLLNLLWRYFCWNEVKSKGEKSSVSDIFRIRIQAVADITTDEANFLEIKNCRTVCVFLNCTKEIQAPGEASRPTLELFQHKISLFFLSLRTIWPAWIPNRVRWHIWIRIRNRSTGKISKIFSFPSYFNGFKIALNRLL